MKSATAFSLMVDGSGSRGCRIVGRLGGQYCQKERFHRDIKAHDVAAGKWLYRLGLELIGATAGPRT